MKTLKTFKGYLAEGTTAENIAVNRDKIKTAHEKLKSDGYTHVHSEESVAGGVSHHYLSGNGSHKKVLNYPSGTSTSPKDFPIKVNKSRLPDFKISRNQMKSLKEFINEKRSSGTAWVILHTDKKIILGKRAPLNNNPNQWNFFGGHIDDGETPVQAGVRELKEETQYDISPSLLKQVSVVGTAHYFSAKITDPEDVKTTGEISKVVRYKLTDLPANLHVKTQDFFDRLDNLLT